MHLVAPADIAVGVVGACLLLPGELLALNGPGAPVLPAAALLLACGWFIGLAIGLAQGLGRAARLGPWALALVRALPSLVATVPVSRHLFDGAFAATLPGAAWAAWWLPAVATLALWPALRLADAIVQRRAGRLVLGVALVLATAAVEFVNRRVQRSEYPDVHTFLVVVACVTAGVAARLLLGPRRWPGTSAPWVHGARAVAVVILAGLGAAATFGFEAADARMAVSTSGMHTRMLVRLGRGLADLDGDGHAALFAGGDCDDRDAARFPGAPEVSGNDVDENCDGITGEEPAAREIIAAKAERKVQLGKWRDGPEVTDLLARTRPMNVVLVAVDTLRADMLVDTPANRADFPRLFELLDASRHFTRTFAPAAGTDLSMSGVLTGQIDPFATKESTLAEALRAQGRTTHAVIPSEVIRYVGKAMLTRGLDGHDRLVNDLYQRDVGSYATGPRTTSLSTAFLDAHRAGERRDQPFFLWSHYFDVHEHHEIKLANLRDLVGDVGELDRAGRYRLMVRVVDQQIGALLDGLRERGLWDSTIVVLVADHGEGLGEDPRLPENHGRFLYNALVHVPMAIRIPGVPPARIDRAVSLLDSYPTLLELVGAPVPDVDGESLLPHLVDGAPEELTGRTRPLPLNETDQFGVVMWPHKLLVRREDNLAEVFDLSRDFGETHNLGGGDPTLMQALYAAYGTLSSVEIDRSGKGRRARDRVAQAGADDDDGDDSKK